MLKETSLIHSKRFLRLFLMSRVCKVCGVDISHKLAIRLFCGRSCAGTFKMNGPLKEKLLLSKLGKARPDSKERMLKDNPMASLETRKKVSDSLKRGGHKPPILGGNGRGMTVPQSILFNYLKETYSYLITAEAIVPTISVRDEMIPDTVPPHYKVDVMIEDLKIAVEVDGGSHASPTARIKDAKKDKCLIKLGYRVIRVKNKSILENMEEVKTKLAEVLCQ